jgi:hypothetical protein
MCKEGEYGPAWVRWEAGVGRKARVNGMGERRARGPAAWKEKSTMSPRLEHSTSTSPRGTATACAWVLSVC